MKKQVFLGLILMVFVLAGLQAENKKGPVLTFKNERHDYGTIYLDNMPEFKLDIELTNTGDEPLILSNVRACCGTRVTAWPREPILPGNKAVIQINFRLAPRPQRLSRTVTITSNNTNRPVTIYRITGQVVERE
jgi:hypothetical protein